MTFLSFTKRYTNRYINNHGQVNRLGLRIETACITFAIN